MKAILVVSFGTSYEETRKKSIEAIEREIGETFPEYRVYRAWTSQMIIRKLRERDGYEVDTVSQAMERMLEDGVRELIVQPTHVVNGVENDRMKEDVARYANRLETVSFGAPLLTSDLDYERLVTCLKKEFSELPEDTALVWMGHGTSHYVNSAYAALDYRFKDMGCGRMYVGTVEAYPELESVMDGLGRGHCRKVLLSPLMMVAGDHAHNDMADGEDSWKGRLEAEGYEVTCLLKGLGEYAGVREILVDHIRQAVRIEVAA